MGPDTGRAAPVSASSRAFRRRQEHASLHRSVAQDHRFVGGAWREPPFSQIYQYFLQWWHNATTGIRGVAAGNERIVAFVARQILDIFSASNFVLTNPEVLRQTLTEGG